MRLTTATTTQKALRKRLEQIPSAATTTKQIINLSSERIFRLGIAMLIEALREFDDTIRVRWVAIILVMHQTRAVALTTAATIFPVVASVTVSVIVSLAFLALSTMSTAVFAIVAGFGITVSLLGRIVTLRIVFATGRIGRMSDVGFEIESHSTCGARTRSLYTICDRNSSVMLKSDTKPNWRVLRTHLLRRPEIRARVVHVADFADFAGFADILRR